MIFCGMMVTSGPENARRHIISRSGCFGKVTFVSGAFRFLGFHRVTPDEPNMLANPPTVKVTMVPIITHHVHGMDVKRHK